jgi:two-component system NtrC family sensor kinase
VGTVAFRLLHPADALEMTALVRHGSGIPGFSLPVELRLRHRDGSYRVVAGVGRNMLDDPVIGGVVFNFRDISERRRVEDERARLAEAVEQAAEGIVITDATGRISYVNPAFEHITGYTRDDVMGGNPRILKSGRQDAAFYRTLWATLTRGEAWSGRLTNRRKDGSLYEAVAVISPVRSARGEIVQYVAVQRDVTHERGLEEQLRQAQKLEAVGQLTGGIAHDFNNILAVVIANTELVAAGLPADRADLRVDLEEIRAAARNGSVMVKKLLGFSRRADLVPVPTDLATLITDLTGLARRVVPANIHLETAVEPGLPPVMADAGALQQILLNLVTNARDAMPQGGQVTIGAHQKGGQVCVSVSDTGTGMDEATQARLFEPFFTTKPAGKGTGLGLAMVHGLVMQHGGRVDVESALGRGTTVRLCLPQAAAAPDAQSVEAMGELRGGSETILIAEDEAVLRRAAAKLLQRLGYRVLAAADGQEALDLCRAEGHAIDLIVADGQMPRLSGPQLYEALRAEGRATRFLLASGYIVRDGADGGVLTSAIPFLAKPWTVTELAARVRELLDQPATP